MKRFLLALAALCTVVTMATAASDDGTFRGKWWNYYDRGLASAELGDWQAAAKDLQQAIKMRDQDQRMARTYGMHFIDYFPHRELGVVYFQQGDMTNAARELELSIKGVETAKATVYLNKVAQKNLLQQKTPAAAPEISIIAPASDSRVKTSTVVLKGKASGAGQVAKIAVNGSPYRFDRARQSVEFVQEVPVEDGQNEIVVAATDLLGTESRKSVTVIVDRDGPSVQIFEIKPEEEAGKRYLRVVGEISDATWISKLQVNGQAVDVSGEKSYPLNLRVARGAGAKIRIEAADPFENETSAEIDAEKELVAFNRPLEPFLIAALNADKLIAFDKKPPEVALKAAADSLPPVFAERYSVDGEASDNRNIGRIVVNGKEVFTRGGKKVFFSKLVNLREGKNDITVDIYDTSDNRTTRTFTVTRKVPSIMQNASRMSITVLPFDGGKAAQSVQTAYDQLIGAFIDQKRFSIVERTKLDKVLLEQRLTKEKLTDPENSIRVGKLMSADAVLATTVREDDRSLEVVARIISTETAEVLAVKDAFVEDKSIASVRELVAALASKVASEFPVAEGMVVKASGKNIVMDVGEATNLKKNMGVIIFRKGEEIRHPVTKKSLGWDTIKVAEGRVEDVQAAFSKVKLVDRPDSKQVQVKDLIMTK